MGALKSKLFRSKSRSDKPNEDKARKSSKSKKTVNLPESQSARKTVDPRLPFSNYRQIFSLRNAWKAIQRAMEECSKETFISLLNKHPRYRAVFTDVKGLKDGDLEELRFHEDFELKAMCMYNIFDDVIANLEEVNKALRTIEYDAEATDFTAKMIKAYKDPFIYTIRMHLGSDRFTEATENNFNLLYQFVETEMCKYVRDDTGEPDVEETDDTTVPVVVRTDDNAVPVVVENATISGTVTAEVEKVDVTESDIPDADADADPEDPVTETTDDAPETAHVSDTDIVIDSQIEVKLCDDNAT